MTQLEKPRFEVNSQQQGSKVVDKAQTPRLFVLFRIVLQVRSRLLRPIVH